MALPLLAGCMQPIAQTSVKRMLKALGLGGICGMLVALRFWDAPAGESWSRQRTAAMVVAGAFLIGYLLTWLARRLAPRLGLVDRPGGRKRHASPTPLMGGLAVMLAIVAGFFLLPLAGIGVRLHEHNIGWMMLSGLLLCGLGLWDDKVPLSPRYKFLGQIAATLPFALAVGSTAGVDILGLHVPLGWLTVPVLTFWLLSCENVVNLIDGHDGLAGSIGAIAALSLAAIGALQGAPTGTTFALLLAGSLTGFLLHNRPPARIFLGDAGSMPIGFFVGAIAFNISTEAGRRFCFVPAVVILCIPFFDTFVAMLRRKLTGRGIGEADRMHIHHRFLDWGLSASATLLALVGLCALAAVGAVASVLFDAQLLAVFTSLFLCSALIGSKLFAYEETVLLAGRIRHSLRSFRPTRKTPEAQTSSVRVGSFSVLAVAGVENFHLAQARPQPAEPTSHPFPPVDTKEAHSMDPLRALVVIGTRPEAIKLAPLIGECRADPAVRAIVCFTGQHREMLAQVADYFALRPDVDLDVMQPNQGLTSLTARCLEGIDAAAQRFEADCILAQGDTTTALAAAVAAFYRRLPFIHVEAGLRTGDLQSPWPEEFNRRIAALATSLHCAPTAAAAGNLRREGIPPWTIHVTGNTVIDALYATLKRERQHGEKWRAKYASLGERPLVLITGHRRENFGSKFESICRAVATLAHRFSGVEFIYPVHLNPCVREPVFRLLGKLANVQLVEPAAYPEFVWLMDRARVILTDSGGVQEEAPSLGKPVVVMRETTERPEAVEVGAVRLAGTAEDSIVENVSLLLTDESAYRRCQVSRNPYGDGLAAPRIVALLRRRAWLAADSAKPPRKPLSTVLRGLLRLPIGETVRAVPKRRGGT